MKEQQSNNDDALRPGSLVLAPYKKGPKWPACVRALAGSQKKRTISYKYLPIYQGDYVFRSHPNQLDVFSAETQLPEDADHELIDAYELARELQAGGVDKALEFCINPPPRPAAPSPPPRQVIKAEPRKRVKAAAAAAGDDQDTDDEHHAPGDAAAANRRNRNLVSGDEDDVLSPADEQRVHRGEPSTKRVCRSLACNEIVFAKAPSIRRASNSQIVLIHNPDQGVGGLWPAIPVSVDENRGFGVFKMFPLASSPRKGGATSRLTRTTNIAMFKLPENHINAALVYTKERDPRLHAALADVRAHLIAAKRFDEAAQTNVKFEIAASKVRVEVPQDEEAVDSQLTVVSKDGHLNVRNEDAPIHRLPKRRLQEAKALRSQMATARAAPEPAAMWLVKQPLHSTHFELKSADLLADVVRRHFEGIWSGETHCRSHVAFFKNLDTRKPCFPSSYQINACTGGLVSTETLDLIIQGYNDWVKLAIRLPRLPYVDKFRYTMEVMIYEACIFVLSEKSNMTRKQAENFMIVGQEYSFALERGHQLPELRERVDALMPKSIKTLANGAEKK